MSTSNKTEIDRPVFLLGSGRSGTTVLYHLLALHEELCWFSNLTNRIRVSPSLVSTGHRVLNLPVIGKRLRSRIINRKKRQRSLHPVEAEFIYDECGFRSDRRSTEIDYTDETEKRIRHVIQGHMKGTGHPRFLSKQTANNQRFRLLDRIFPDCIFIHLIRDGRAVANSANRQDWGKSHKFWWMKDENSEVVYAEHIELCGIHWVKNVEELLHADYVGNDRYLEIRYESLTQDVHGVLRKILNFCDLSAQPAYLNQLPKTLTNMNHRWNENLSEKQQQLLLARIKPTLSRLGYE